MAKFRPGIPENYSLDVEPVGDLGDSIDERGPSIVPPRKGREATPPSPPAAPTPEPSASPATEATPPPTTPKVPVQATVLPAVQPAPPAAPVMQPPQPGRTAPRT